VAQPGNAVDC